MFSHLKWTSNPHQRKKLDNIRSNGKCKEHAHHRFNLLGTAKDLGSFLLLYFSFPWGTDLAFQISGLTETRWKFPLGISGSVAGFIWSLIPHSLLWVASVVVWGELQGCFGRWLSTPFFHPVGVLASNRGYQQVTIPDKDAIIHRGSSWKKLLLE